MDQRGSVAVSLIGYLHPISDSYCIGTKNHDRIRLLFRRKNRRDFCNGTIACKQPRPQGFSLKKWVGQSPGDEVGLQSRRILGRDPWIVFRDDVVSPSWKLILPESWDESKSVFKGEVDGFKTPPLPLSLFRCFSRWRPRSMYLGVFVKKRLLCSLRNEAALRGSLSGESHIGQVLTLYWRNE